MVHLWKRHRRILAQTGGALLIVFAIGSLFWEQSEGVSEEVRHAQANVKRMEAAVSTSVSKATAPPVNHVGDAYYESRKEHLRLLVIIVALVGIGLLVYGFISQKEHEES